MATMTILVPPPLDPSPSSSSSSSSLASLPQQKERRIRFAPLPQPRVDDVDEDESIELNAADVDQGKSDDESTLQNIKLASDGHIPFDKVPLNDSKYSSFHGSEPSSPPYLAKPTTQQLLSHPPISNAPTWSRPKSLNLLRPFPFRRSSPNSTHSLTPTVSIDSATTPTNASRTSANSKRRKSLSAEGIFTLGAINLFRPSSKQGKDGHDSRRNSASSWGSSLWSGGSTAGLHSSCPSSPSLRRTESMQSSQSNVSSTSKAEPVIKAVSRPRSSSVSLASSTPSPPTAKLPTRPRSAGANSSSKRGIPMLNGRVYGSKRHRENVNHFANIKDEEPSFVEWGYGGMGSVKGGKHAGVDDRWQRLHATAEVNTGGGKIDEDDDGTGMAWVKKRKEQREKEKAAAAAAAQATEADPATAASTEGSNELHSNELHTPAQTPLVLSSVPVTTESDAPSTSQPSSSIPDVVKSPAHPSTPASEAVSSEPSGPSSPQLEHNLKAVNLPAPRPRRHMHRASSLDATGGSNSHIPLSSSPGPSALASQIAATREPEAIASGSESEEDSESEVNRQGDDEEEEDEDDEDVQEMNQQALSAGVEKISRHHENK